MKKPELVAEIGCNHRGDVQTALKMIEVAAQFGGAGAVKFQKRTPRELLTREEYDAPHPNPANSYGASYGEHREFLEFDIEVHARLMEHARNLGVRYGCSVWDVTAAVEVSSVSPDFIKVPSAANTDLPLLRTLSREYPGEIHVSLGMTTRAEEDELMELIAAEGRLADTVVFACTSGYPVAFDDLCLLEISRLREQYDGKVKDIGFSGHHLGIAADVAAMTLGASVIERHFTLDRTWKGTDHAASLEPDGLRRLSRDLDAVHRALTFRSSELLPVELAQREKLKRIAR